MKKLFLFLAVALFVGCTDFTDDINTINDRLDKLEQEAIPSIEEQIETLLLVTAELEKVDDELQKALNALKRDVQANAKDIAALEAQAEALGTRITALNNYVDSEIKKAKDAAAAAYATIDALNSAKSELSALQTTVTNLSTELNAKIDTAVASLSSQIDQAVKTLNDKIADLEARLKVVENKVENLLARIQSVSYIPTYNDNKATLKYIGGISQVALDFKVSPKECVAELEKVWESAIKIDAVYTETRAVSFVDMPIVEFEADAENGVISVIASGENLSEGLFAGTQSASASLTISDGNSSVTSEYVPMIAQEVDMYQLSVPANQIWYTSTDDNVVEPFNKDGFGAHIVSNIYKNGMGTIVFDAPITSVSDSAYCDATTELGVETLKSIALPEGVTTIGEYAFCQCTNLVNINIPSSTVLIKNIAFAGTNSLKDVYITNLSDYCRIKFGSGTACPLNTDAYLNINGSRLTEFIVPEDITIVRFSAFYHNSNITNVVMHDNVTTIGGRAFQGCSNVESVTLGSGIKEIHYDVFASCPNLKTVYCKATTPPLANPESDGWKSFNSNATGRLIYVPTASVDAYKAADGWSDYASYIFGYDF